MRALLIDSRPPVLSDLRAVASGFGPDLQLVYAGSLAAARQILSSEVPIDVVLVDLGGDPAGALGSIAELQTTRSSLPFVVLSTDRQGVAAAKVPLALEEIDWRFRRTAHASLGLLGLTRRQTEVLSLLLDGHSNKVIAREMSLSVETVKDHVTSVMRSLNVRSRTQAVVEVTRRMQRQGGRSGEPAVSFEAMPRAARAPATSVCP